MAIKHFCDRCGKEVAYQNKTVLALMNKTASFLIRERDFCPRCMEYIKNEFDRIIPMENN